MMDEFKKGFEKGFEQAFEDELPALLRVEAHWPWAAWIIAVAEVLELIL